MRHGKPRGQESNPVGLFGYIRVILPPSPPFIYFLFVTITPRYVNSSTSGMARSCFILLFILSQKSTNLSSCGQWAWAQSLPYLMCSVVLIQIETLMEIACMLPSIYTNYKHLPDKWKVFYKHQNLTTYKINRMLMEVWLTAISGVNLMLEQKRANQN